MKQEIFDIFNTSSCLTENEIKNYFSGNLSPSEIRRIETHLADCTMCNDELEGYELLNDKDKLDSIISEINSKIDKQTTQQKVIPLTTKKRRFISVAASLLLIAVTAFLIRFYNSAGDKNLAETPVADEILSEKITETQSEEIIPEKTTYTENTEKESVKSGIDETRQEENTVTEKEETGNTAEPEQDKKTEVYTENNSDETFAAVSEDIALPEEKQLAETTVETDKSDAKTNAGNNFFATTRGDIPRKSKAEEKKTNEKYKSLRESGLLSYDLKIYDEALNDFENYLKYKPGDNEILFKTGTSYFKTKKYEKAISYFDKVSEMSSYNADAQWFKAQSLVKLGKTDEAKALLNTIISREGKYKTQAEELLKKL